MEKRKNQRRTDERRQEERRGPDRRGTSRNSQDRRTADRRNDERRIADRRVKDENIYEDRVEGRNSILELLKSDRDVNKIWISRGEKHRFNTSNNSNGKRKRNSCSRSR